MQYEQEIKALRANGKTYKQIVEILGCSKSTVAYHVGEGVKEKHGKTQHDKRRKAKQDVLKHYGTVCAQCGFSDIRALHIDHIHNNGNKERKETDYNGGWNFYVFLRERGYPEGYQTLCANCNSIKQWEHAYGPIV